MTPEEQENLKKRVGELKRKLGELELTKARYGFSTPPYVNMEIQDTKKEIKQLEQQLANATVLTETQTAGSVYKPTLTQEQLRQLVDLLVELPAFSDAASRTTVISLLPGGIKGSVSLNNTLRPDAINLLHIASEYPNGLQKLVEVLTMFDEGSIVLTKFREHINQITQS